VASGEVLEQRVIQLEKRMDKMEIKVEDLDQRMDDISQFVGKIEVMFNHLNGTMEKMEKKLDQFIDKQEAKEEQARQEEKQQHSEETARWKSVTWELVKYILLILGAGAASQGITEIGSKLTQ
jgi:predicted nuclease with TOPRIM domain